MKMQSLLSGVHRYADHIVIQAPYSKAWINAYHDMQLTLVTRRWRLHSFSDPLA